MVIFRFKRYRAICIIQALVMASLMAHLILHGIRDNQLPLGSKYLWALRNTSKLGTKYFLSLKNRSLNAILLERNFSDLPVDIAPASSPSSLEDIPSAEDQVSEPQSNRRPFFELFDVNSKMEPDNCDNDFGFGLSRRWKAAGRVWCSPTVTCHAIQQTGHGGDGDNLCIIENATLNMRHVFNDTARMREIAVAYRDSTHADMPYVHFQAPVVSTQCEKDPNEWKQNMLPGWNSDWMSAGLNISHAQSCNGVRQKPLLIIQRDGFANFYHDSEDFFNSFLALLITGLRPDEVTVLISDLFPWGPYESFWKHLFPDIRTAWEMKDVENACFSKIVIGIFGPASPLTLINQATSCFGSPLVKGYASWVWSSFGLNASNIQRRATEVLWMSRKSSVLWPEQAYCDDRYFVCADWQHLGVRSLGRVIKNEEEIIGILQHKPEIKLSHSDFNTLPFAEQIAADLSSDVMVGPHGAGLTHLLFLPDDSCVFEIFIDGSENNIHYRNMASWRGIPYHSMVTSNPVPAQEVIASLWEHCIHKFVAARGFVLPVRQSVESSNHSQSSAT